MSCSKLDLISSGEILSIHAKFFLTCTNTHCQVLWACLKSIHGKTRFFLYHTYFLTWSNLLQITEVIRLSLLTLYYKKLLLQPFKVQLLLSLPLPHIILSPPRNCTGLAKTDIRSELGGEYFFLEVQYMINFTVHRFLE